MLKLAESFSDIEQLPADPYAARIQAYCKTYGFDTNFALFWVQGSNTAVCSIDSDMTVCCGDGCDFEELRLFIDTVGFKTLSCEDYVREKLGFRKGNSSYIVEYHGEKVNAPVNSDFSDRELYSLLTECGFELGEYGEFLADFRARINHNTALTAVKYSDGTLVASASALFTGENSVLLGAVATKPQMRGRGYASELVKALASRFDEKRVFLFCRNDSLLEFYGKIGFSEYGKWSVIYNEKSKGNNND